MCISILSVKKAPAVGAGAKNHQKNQRTISFAPAVGAGDDTDVLKLGIELVHQKYQE